MKREFRTTSKRARQLLSRAEGLDVDFKASAAGVSSDDIVAFANSDSGGALLLGVEESKDAQGRQRGRICGCPVDDRTRQSILNRALSCSPPVVTEVYVENASDTPFIRVEIPTGQRRPYCTGGGTYKIRDDGQNRPLKPAELLAIFLSVEESQFVDRFRAAANELSGHLEAMQTAMVHNFMSTADLLGSELDRITGDFADLDRTLQARLKRILELAESAVGQSEEAAAGLSDVRDVSYDLVNAAEKAHRDNSLLQQRLLALLEHHGVEDPRERRHRVMMQSGVEMLLERYPDWTIADFSDMIEHARKEYGDKPRRWVQDVLDRTHGK